MTDRTPSDAALDALVRSEGTRVLATLVRLTGSVQLAEDAVADAESGVFTSVIAVYKALGGIPAP